MLISIRDKHTDEERLVDSDGIRDVFLEAAAKNKTGICTLLFGQVVPGALANNTEALRIAAENKSYDTFEAMLKEAEENLCPIATTYAFARNKDWDEAHDIAETDLRLFRALDAYETQYEQQYEDLRKILGTQPG